MMSRLFSNACVINSDAFSLVGSLDINSWILHASGSHRESLPEYLQSDFSAGSVAGSEDVVAAYLLHALTGTDCKLM